MNINSFRTLLFQKDFDSCNKIIQSKVSGSDLIKIINDLIFVSASIKLSENQKNHPISVINSIKGSDYIFHAAALKQVPSCEFYPMEAVKTNILGTDNVLEAAINSKVSKVVVLSTDKAVYPINAMGISKAMMEKVMDAKARMIGEGKTIFCATRYGNVMASRGSVIPLFIDLIKSKKPLTITDPNMTRFLMSLDNSVDLVLHAFLNASQGDLFVQKAPASTIQDLAQALIELFQSDSTIDIIGSRHGEKLYESLLSREEILRADDEDQYYRVPMDARDLNYGKYTNQGDEDYSIESDDYNSHNTTRLKVSEIKKLLLTLDFIQDALNA